MRLQTEEWRQFVPGVRIYNGKKTLFYNGEILWEESDNDGEDRPLVYDYKERNSWEAIIVLPGVEVIPVCTFYCCTNVKTVIMPDSVKRIENEVFFCCGSLKFVKLSTNLEYIGYSAYFYCESLTTMFIPPSCREICRCAFRRCKELSILGIPQHVQLGESVFQNTALIKNSPFELDEDGDYHYDNDETVIRWIKSINDGETFALHRASASFNPLYEIIYSLVKQHGIEAMNMSNAIGITPSQYLAANTFADISEKEIINRYISEMMGEVMYE